MGIDKRSNPADHPRAQMVAAGVLFAMVFGGVFANIVYRQEVFSPVFAIAFVTAACALVGVKIEKP